MGPPIMYVHLSQLLRPSYIHPTFSSGSSLLEVYQQPVVTTYTIPEHQMKLFSYRDGDMAYHRAGT